MKPLTTQGGHFASLGRRLPHPVRIAHIGHLPAKTSWVDTQFDVVAFSLILDGTGQLLVDGQTHDVQAPCVICEFPGPHFRYGPATTWYEIYFTYEGSSLSALTELGLVKAGRYLWPVRSLSRIRRKLEDMVELVASIEQVGNVDRLDRLCEWLVAETLLDEKEVGQDRMHRKVLAIRDWLEAHCSDELDLRRVAQRHGLSFTTFRRYWAQYFSESPARFVNAERMKRACRLLCETDLPIADIARQLGFDDPLYFSKKFHRHSGETARDYRRKYAGLERSQG